MELLNWNRQGIIQGPGESDAEFMKRAHYLQEFKHKVRETLQFDIQEDATPILEEVFPKTRALYDIEPNFPPLFFSNKQLSFLYGGSSWIVQLEKESPTAAIIQLKEAYATKKRVLFYDRDEILVHELAHIGRMAYDEPRYEEMLAWRSSSNSFRRFLGPLFISLKETSFFAFLLITLFVVDLMAIFFGDERLFFQLQYLKVIPVAYLAYAGVRLVLRQRTLARCLSKLSDLLGLEKANAVLYRLSDKEIALFAKGPIEEYVKKQESLRWKVIRDAYFFSSPTA